MSNTNTFTSINFIDYLKTHTSSKGENYTHTRIGDKLLNIYGGSYNIQNLNEFWEMYYEHVFLNNNKEYLTEKQLIDDGPLLIDIDMRYDISIKERQHTKEHIIDLINLYLNKLNEIYEIKDGGLIDVYVFEKPNVNILENKTKDGIHLIFTIKMTKLEQSFLRKKIIKDLKLMWDNLPLINNFEDIIDEGITKGFVNWQLYGSRKPNNQAYLLTYYMTLIYEKEDDNWIFKDNNLSKIDLKKHLPLMSARYSNHIRYDLKDNEELKNDLEEELKELNNKNKKTKMNSNNIDFKNYKYNNIKNENDLNNLIEIFLETLTIDDYELKEIHEFTMILPDNYYGNNSYNKWIRVGWALKNTNDKLFLTWLKFSSKSETFDYNEIEKLHNMWLNFENKNQDGLTNRSIMYWAKTDNYTEYKKIRNNTISYYIEKTLEMMIIKDKISEFDLAYVLYQLCKDNYVCVSIKNNIWYEYKNNKWHEIDSGNSLRLIISTKMHDIYMHKSTEVMEKIAIMADEDKNTDSLKKRSSKIGDLCILLKTTSWKNNIMKEAKELFYDSQFMNKLDSNPYLLCFNNYVIDFKNKIHRKGKPDDYITKSTNIDYIPYDNLKGLYPYNKSLTYEIIIQEIHKFMNELFPNIELRKYMWEHLASVLIGTNDNQTFNIYTGSGCNGKSKLVELMSKCLGDYKATVPITLITQKRNSIGSISPEIVQLMGIRYAVMQEPSKGEKINEGIMKEITGGDPIQGRALFKDTITFTPQFKLVVCTNVLFDIKTNDDGTWRRIRICDFMSKFNDAPYQNEDKFPKINFPYQYLIDKKIDEKFEIWSPVFASILVNIAYETEGKVKDSNIVMAVSDKYREGQDYLTEFAKEKIIRKRDGKIKKTEIIEEFKNWYIMNYGRTNIPNGKEICDYMDKNFGKCNKGKWINIEINYQQDSDDDYYDNDNNDENETMLIE